MKLLRPFIFLIGSILCTLHLTAQSITLSPDNGDPGTTFTVSISGTGTTFSIQSTTTAQISNGVNNYTFTGAASSTTMFNGSLTLPSDAPSGSYNATIWREGNSGTFWSCNSCFTVNSIAVCSLAISGSSTDVSCNGFADGAIDITVSGNTSPVTYSWSNGSTTEDVSNLTAGTYSVTVTESASCTAEMAFIVVEPDSIITNTSGVDLLCNNDSSGLASVMVTGANNPTYLWSNGAITADISNLAGGTHYVTVTDGTCQTVDSVTLLEPMALSLSLITTSITQVGADDGKMSASVTGGTPPYIYNWSTSDTTASISGLAPGTYSVTVTDLNLCMVIDSAIIPDINCTLTVDVTGGGIECFGDNSGIASTAVSGNRGPVTYAWSNGATTPDLSDLNAGKYHVTVTDSVGCTAVDSVIIGEPDPLIILIDSIDQDEGNVSTMILGGTPPYNFSWIDLSDTTEVDTVMNTAGLAPGIYVLRVLDNHLCTALSDTVRIEESSSYVSPEIDAAIKVYPNPMYTQLTIEVPWEMNDAHISIFNTVGHLIQRKKINGSRIQLFDNEIPSGVIYLKIHKESAFTIRKVVNLK